MCCAVVGGDVCEGSEGSGGGAPSVFCSGACGAERLQEPGGLTGVQTVAGRCLGLELERQRRRKTIRFVYYTHIQFHKHKYCKHTVATTMSNL